MIHKMIVLMILLLSINAHAITFENKLQDPNLEQRASKLFQEIRCVVCSGESVSDSRADLAKDVRKIIRSKIQSGKTNQQIKNDLVASYGNSILMRPPVSQNTFLLWFGPVILLLGGILGIAIFFYKTNKRHS